jgi:DNA-binding transcriptional MocR family regulator
MEDPGYFGATTAFRNAGARIVPVPVDEHGLSVSQGRRACRAAKGAYLTPAHQFPLGMTMPLERRLALLAWAREAGAFLIEDDYDSEYRFEGRPAPALQGLDKSGSVILVGSFNKLLFPALRLGYIVAPPAWSIRCWPSASERTSMRRASTRRFSATSLSRATWGVISGACANCTPPGSRLCRKADGNI